MSSKSTATGRPGPANNRADAVALVVSLLRQSGFSSDESLAEQIVTTVSQALLSASIYRPADGMWELNTNGRRTSSPNLALLAEEAVSVIVRGSGIGLITAQDDDSLTARRARHSQERITR